MRALIVVDVQNDFVEGGSLQVTGGKKVARNISEYLKNNSDKYKLVVATRDWHDGDNDNCGHFSNHPDFVDSWPVHCVSNSSGSNYAPEFDTTLVNVHIVKGMGVPAYSGFEGKVTSLANGTIYKTTLQEVLEEHGITDVDVVGLATDYCVLETALDAEKLELDVRVLNDLTASVSGNSAFDTPKLLNEPKIKIINSKDA